MKNISDDKLDFEGQKHSGLLYVYMYISTQIINNTLMHWREQLLQFYSYFCLLFYLYW